MAKLYDRFGKTEDADKWLKERLFLAEQTGSIALQIDAHSDLTKFYRNLKNAVINVIFITSKQLHFRKSFFHSGGTL